MDDKRSQFWMREPMKGEKPSTKPKEKSRTRGRQCASVDDRQSLTASTRPNSPSASLIGLQHKFDNLRQDCQDAQDASHTSCIQHLPTTHYRPPSTVSQGCNVSRTTSLVSGSDRPRCICTLNLDMVSQSLSHLSCYSCGCFDGKASLFLSFAVRVRIPCDPGPGKIPISNTDFDPIRLLTSSTHCPSDFASPMHDGSYIPHAKAFIPTTTRGPSFTPK